MVEHFTRKLSLTLALVITGLSMSNAFGQGHETYFVVQGANLTEVSIPPYTPSQIVVWPESTAKSIPVYFYNWQVFGIPLYLDPTSVANDFMAATSVWSSASDNIFAFVQESSTYGVDVAFDSSTADWSDPESEAGLTFNAVEYDQGASPPRDVFVANAGSTQTETATTITTIIFNNTASFNYVWTDDTLGLSSSEICFRQVALHELGHVIGLGDDYQDAGSVMNDVSAGADFHGLIPYDDSALANVETQTLTGIDTGSGGSPGGPPVPTSITATIDGQNIAISWAADPIGANATYSVYKLTNNGWTMISPPSDTSTSFMDYNAVSAIPVTYQIAASNSYGTSYSNWYNVNLATSTISSNTTWSGTVYVSGNVSVNSGDTLTIAPGTSVCINPDRSISTSSNAVILSDGVTGSPIYFRQAVPDSQWNEIDLNSNNNQFADCVFDGGTDNVYTSHSQGNTFTDCTFENASGDGLLLEGSGSSIDNCTFEHNQYGIVLGYAGPTASIVQSTISDNSAVGLYMASGTISQFTNNAVENNGSYGIDIEGGILYMGNGTGYYGIGSNPVASSPTQGAGKNLINNNGSSQIYVDTGGEVYVGDLQFNGTDYSLGEGFNRVTSSSTYYIYNLAMTQTYESEEQWPVPAADTYWGGSVGSENFYGTVNYYSDQLLSDPSIGAGATNMLQDVTTPGGAKTPATLMTAAMAAKIYKDAPSSGMGQFFVNLKNQMMQVRSAIMNPKTGLIRPRLVGYLNSLCSFDTNDVTQERGAVYDLITSYYRELTSGSFSDETDRLCSEAALVAEVQDEVRGDELDSAQGLINEYSGYVQNNDNKRTLLFAQMQIDEQQSQAGSASGVLSQIEAFQPDSKQKRRYEAPNYAALASLVGQGSAGPGQSQNEKLASEETNTVPTKFALLQNYPNPFNPTTTIDYDLATPANVSLIVYDVTGQEVTVLASGQESTGSHSAIFNGSRFASGVYFVRLVAQGQNGRQYIKTIKMLELK